MLSKLGIGFSNSVPVDDLLQYAKLAEPFGLTFWLNEGYYNRSATVLMSALACETNTIELGLGIVSPLLRHPFTIAMEAGTLDELSNGRLSLGLGIAASGARRHDIDVRKVHPLMLMRESERIIRGLLGGKTVDPSEMFPMQKGGVKLGFKPAGHRIPLLLGAMNPQMLRLGGELFDGVIFNYPCPYAYAKFAIEQIRDGVKTRDHNMQAPRVVAFHLVSVAENHDEAVEASKKYLPHYLSRAYPITLQYAGVNPEDTAPILKALERNEHDEAHSLISDELVEKLTLSGTPEECISEIRKYSELGINQFVAELIVGTEPKESIEMIGKEIAPRVVSKNTES